jgi:3'(2'), 5'-bisphosphate nucleotidase
MNDAAKLALAITLVERAAGAIMQIRAAGFSVVQKSDQTPVTIADTTAERLILEGLRAAAPDIPAIGEEEVAAGIEPAPGAQYWLVDPLDGTREFAAGREEFVVNIGLVRGGEAVLGAVAIPAYGAVYAGGRGLGAIRKTSAGTVAIQVRKPPAEGLAVMASRHYASDPELAAFLGTLKVASVTNIGSAVKFCRIAEGTADIYPRLGRTMEWDTAAPQAVVEAAGGSVTTFAGEVLRYGKKAFENPPFICRGG